MVAKKKAVSTPPARRVRRYSRRAVLAGGIGLGASLAGCTQSSHTSGGGDGQSGGSGGASGGSGSAFEPFRFDDPPNLDGWPSRQYSQTNLGWNPNGSGPVVDAGVEWFYDPGTEENFFGGSPVVADGTVVCGNSDGNLYAVDADTGEHRWTGETGAEIRWGSPTVVDGVVYVGSTDHTFYAFDLGTGEPVWTREVGHQITSTPAADGGRLYFATDGGLVYAVDGETGEVVWQTPERIGGRIQSGLAAADGTVYVTGSQVYAFDGATGEQRWAADFSANQPTNGTPTVAGDYVLGEFGQYVGMIGTDGTALGGGYGMGVNGWGSPAVAHDRVYVAHKGGSGYPTVRALSVQHSGVSSKYAVEWEAETEAGVFSSPVVVDGLVYVAASDPALYAYDAESGALAWTFDVPVADYSTPAVVDGLLYVGGRDGLYAISGAS